MAGVKLELVGHLSIEELSQRARVRKGVDARELRRWQALKLVAEGQSAQAAASVCGLSKSWVSALVNRFNKEGPKAVADGRQSHPGGAKPLLDAAQQQELARALLLPVPEELGGGLWTGRKVALWIKEKTGKETWPQQGCSYLHRLGFSLKVPRPRHPRAASKEEAREWEKKSGRQIGLHSSGAPGR